MQLTGINGLRLGRGLTRKPRLGFVGLGWIGRHRMQAIAGTGLADIVAIADTSAAALDEGRDIAPGAVQAQTLDDVLAQNPDGVVIATPSALHAEQSIRALQAGAAVFCQKPLARNAIEARKVIAAAQAANRLIATDLSYRHTTALHRIRQEVHKGSLGDIFAVDLVFHNVFGPDKAWFYDPRLSGGGCVMDLGVHLVDMALWVLDFPDIQTASAHLYCKGRPAGPQDIEDFAAATLTLTNGCVIRLACSWRLHLGMDAVIAADFHGTAGGATLRNHDGSFYDFFAHHHTGTTSRTLASPPDDWGGRAAIQWVTQMAEDPGYDPAADRLVVLSEILDMIYRQDKTPPPSPRPDVRPFLRSASDGPG